MDNGSQRLLLVASTVIGGLAFWRLLIWVPTKVLMASYNSWFFVPIDAYPQMIFAMAAAMVFHRRGQLREAMQDRGSPALAALPLLIGVALFLWGHYVSTMSVVLLSFIFVSLGASLLWFGVRFAKTLLLPLAVLAFAFPIPATLTNQAFAGLRVATATHATALLSLTGLSVIREGNLIHGSGVLAHVIDTCSGLGFIQVLTLASVFYVGWFPARTLRGALLIAVAPAIAFGFNLARVCVIILDPSSDLSETHAMQGWLVFGGSISGLLFADFVLGRWLPNRPTQAPRSEPEDTQGEPLPSASGDRARGGPAAVVLAGLLVAMLGVSVWMPSWTPPETRPKLDTNLPAKLGPWKLDREMAIDRNFLWTVRFHKQVYRQYERDGEVVAVFIGYDDRSDRRRSPISPKNAVPGRGHEIVERGAVAVPPWTSNAEWVLSRAGSIRFLSFYWYEGTESLARETLRAVLALDQSPLGRTQPARVIRLTATMGQTPRAREEAEARLQDFAASLAKALGG
jgi:EpsI family protein